MSLFTEEQAATKWCPFARKENRGGDKHASEHTCLGSGCMEWRWKKKDGPLGYCGIGREKGLHER